MSGDEQGGEGDGFGLDQDQLSQVENEILSQEAENRESILGSQADFEVWISTNPHLSKIVMVENFSEILPAIFNFFRAMLGFEIPEKSAEADPKDRDGSDDGRAS